jgi:DNA-binding transcriptional LysR family regulator
VVVRVLRHFLNVARHGSIGKAAGAWDITQPALSKSIRRLKRALEVELFERTVLGTQPTAFGPFPGRLSDCRQAR